MDYECHFVKILPTTTELGKHNCEDTMTKIAIQSIHPKILNDQASAWEPLHDIILYIVASKCLHPSNQEDGALMSFV